MAVINYTAEQINALLAKANEAASQQEIGNLSDLLTTDKDNIVDAVNENFTNADNGKNLIAGALSAKGQAATKAETFSALAGKIGNLKPANYVNPADYAGWMRPYITNADSIPLTGTYATATYVDLTFGVKVGYMGNSLVMAMQGGTSTSYEYVAFSLASAPSGITIQEVHNTSSSYATAMAGLIYGCVLSGFDTAKNYSISVAVNTRDATGDTVTAAITIVEV